jgi:hypothetical protein
MKQTIVIVVLVLVLVPQTFSQMSRSLFNSEKRHVFSSTTREDKFRLQVHGRNIFDSFVTFQIVSWQGKQIYSHRFSMDELMERGPRDRRESKDSLNIIHKLDHFFDDDGFSNPAMKDTLQDNEGNLLSRDEWFEIWKDKTAIGFFYLLGAEDGRGIAYSKKKKKAVQFYACC